jgi:formylglycine-generating enzyme required for sulfatase activity
MGDGVPGCALTDLMFVGTKVLGNGLWGHADMGGNVGEWNLDSWWDGNYALPCTDCATFGANLDRVLRGGDFWDLEDALRVSSRFHDQPDTRYRYLGLRCARSAP